MKKFFAIATLVAVALTGCVKNEVITPNAGEIQFKNFSLSSKALVEAGAFDTNLTFGVEMLKAADDSAWDKGEVVYKTNYWGFNPAKYWPTENGTPIALNFYAYYPYGEDVTVVPANGVSFNNANLGYTIGSQTDYMLAPMAGPYQVMSNDVPVVFEHISSLLLFSAKDVTVFTELQNKVTVNSIKVQNISTTGSYANSFATDVAGTWTPGSTHDFEAITINKAVDTAGVVELTSNNSNPVLVVPTTLKNANEAGAQQVTVNYTVAAYNYGGTAFAEQTFEKSFALKAGSIDKWEQGKKYVYTLSFSLSEELEITFAPTVADWEEGGSVDVTLDNE